jgi:ribosomal protein L20A (L18A)
LDRRIATVRKIADKVLKHVITKALGEKYKIQRADEISKPGLITAQIVERLLGAPLVVADLTGRNENVYYELAIRHAANKPVIHIITAGEDAPFDVKDMRFIPFDLKDPDSIDKAHEKIREQADAIAKGEKPITPVRVAQISGQPSSGKDDIFKLLQALYGALSGLQQEVRETKQSVQILESELLLSPEHVPLSALIGAQSSYLVRDFTLTQGVARQRTAAQIKEILKEREQEVPNAVVASLNNRRQKVCQRRRRRRLPQSILPVTTGSSAESPLGRPYPGLPFGS